MEYNINFYQSIVLNGKEIKVLLDTDKTVYTCSAARKIEEKEAQLLIQKIEKGLIRCDRFLKQRGYFYIEELGSFHNVANKLIVEILKIHFNKDVDGAYFKHNTNEMLIYNVNKYDCNREYKKLEDLYNNHYHK